MRIVAAATAAADDQDQATYRISAVGALAIARALVSSNIKCGPDERITWRCPSCGDDGIISDCNRRHGTADRCNPSIDEWACPLENHSLDFAAIILDLLRLVVIDPELRRACHMRSSGKSTHVIPFEVSQSQSSVPSRSIARA